MTPSLHPLLAVLLLGLAALPAPAQRRAYRLPATNLKEPIIWGSTCEGPEGTGLAFGGQDQKASDGRPHTRIREDGTWKSIHEQLRRNNPLQPHFTRCWALRELQKDTASQARFLYLEGSDAEEEGRAVQAQILPAQEKLTEGLATEIAALQKASAGLGEYEAGQVRFALELLKQAHERSQSLHQALSKGITPTLLQQQARLQIALEQAAQALDAEPPARALSPLVHEKKSGVYVLFAGDHLDYLTNDTWVFDPVNRRWQQRHPAAAPPPRANHTLKATPEGKVLLTGGYTYTSNTDYCGGQYRDHQEGTWIYDLASNRWEGPGLVSATTRVYRTGPFHPDFYLRGPKPDARAFQTWLEERPANTWVATRPAHLPRLNRDWGTAVYDPDRQLILRWSGGHSAHGGTDVLHYHTRSNRWELCYPVEFPLGQLYSNTSYPDGFNFNLRPWITGHTYQNYGYDPLGKKMYFTGRPRHCYVYDPDRGDWTGRFVKPAGMVYNSCFYTLTLCPTPGGLICWTRDGKLFRLDARASTWSELKLQGERLPGAVVDNSTVVYDSKRDRLLFASKPYGSKHPYDGQLYAVDVKTLTVARLSPAGMADAAAISYLCQIRYDEDNDLFLVGATLPPGKDGLRWTPAYDPDTNRWLALKIGGTDPSGPRGRNVSLGLMYDPARKRFWAVDTNSQVYVLRLDRKSLTMTDLGTAMQR
jgi:hypothetical protein